MAVNPVDLGGVAVAVIAAGGAWASQRAAAKASMTNSAVTSRMDAEKEAYERARQFDTETIKRQNDTIAALRLENSELKAKLDQMNERLSRLESTSLMKVVQALEVQEKNADDQER